MMTFVLVLYALGCLLDSRVCVCATCIVVYVGFGVVLLLMVAYPGAIWGFGVLRFFLGCWGLLFCLLVVLLVIVLCADICVYFIITLVVLWVRRLQIHIVWCVLLFVLLSWV